jgi:hypothetical protein
MTLRTIESQFSEALLKLGHGPNSHDLSLNGPISPLTHPKVIWAELQYQNNPQQDAPKLSIPDWNYECFKDLASAQNKYPHISLQLVGKPWMIDRFLSEKNTEALIDFKELGAVVVTKGSLVLEAKNELCDHVLPPMLNYALSPELWGTNGKWPRFHARIKKILEAKNLLVGQEYSGYYPLNLVAKKIENFGFYGSEVDKAYLLVLPWSFSLTALEKLEEVIEREF